MIDRQTIRVKAVERRSGRMLRALLGAALLAAASLASGQAVAAPATLANDADVSAFAARVKAYAGASRVRWVVAAPTRADAEALIANIANHLSLEDRPLISRVKAQSFADNPDVAPGASIPIAWMAPQIGQAQTGPACSWQVWALIRQQYVVAPAGQGHDAVRARFEGRFDVPVRAGADTQRSAKDAEQIECPRSRSGGRRGGEVCEEALSDSASKRIIHETTAR